ncbi:MAG: sigma-54-dependent Fis family transcriptional regulator [Bacteroidales bacterium]|nr:sigma-54-dependent Fis family transcriptional regulator [Bacteroidales bacterium]
MQLISYSQVNQEGSRPNIIDWNPDHKKIIIEIILSKGTLNILGQSNLRLFTASMDHADIINCKEKKDKIDLFRSFGLASDELADKPRKLLFKSNNLGAVKRSINAFVKRLLPSHPACILIIDDSYLQSLIEDLRVIKSPASGQKKPLEKNPIKRLILDSRKDSRMKEISQHFLGTSPDVEIVRAMILKAAESKLPVLILGESGTGKDVIARLINKFSTFNKTPYKVLNCAALPETLAESELFGAKKGSFTNSIAETIGLFAASNGGTIFLDEIGDLSLAIQAKLLLAVENQSIRQIGSTESKENLDVRVISATNRNIDYMVMQHTFRDDLLFRLDTIRINAPPLRSHPEDIPLIAKHIWSKLNSPHELSPEFLDYLKTYSWPGNVREMKTLLNSIRDIFGDESPTRDSIESLRNYRQEGITQSFSDGIQDQARFIRLEAYNRLIKVQNILRAIKINLRPYINAKSTGKKNIMSPDNLKSFVRNQINLLEDLCREPIYFKDLNLFQETTRYRYLLDKALNHWPSSLKTMDKLWNAELHKLDESINLSIFRFIWGKVDM